MALQTRYLFTASMDVEAAQEKLFNEVYDTEHVPLLLKVPGVIAVARLKKTTLTIIIGGEKKTIVAENEPTYSATYEIESPEVLTSPAWGAAVDQGRWPSAPSSSSPTSRSPHSTSRSRRRSSTCSRTSRSSST